MCGYTCWMEPREDGIEVGAVGIWGTCINVLAINRKYRRSVSLDAIKQECESNR